MYFVLKLILNYSKTMGSIQVPVKNLKNTNTNLSQGVAYKFKLVLNYSQKATFCNTDKN